MSVRVRPLLGRENKEERGEELAIKTKNDKSITIHTDKTHIECEYDRVFDIHSTQEDVWEYVKDEVKVLLEGVNVCILAYGQTSTGKTYTMMGPGTT